MRTGLVVALFVAACSGTCEPERTVGERQRAGTVVELDAGRWHTCARLDDGHVECWGHCENLQCGARPEGSTTPLLIEGLTDAAELAIGDEHACARLLDGDVACWGSNSRGELGRLEPKESATPLRVPDVHAAVEIAITGALTCARLSDGGATCWGAAANDPVPWDDAARLPTRVEGLAGAEAIAVDANSACARTAVDAWHCWSWTKSEPHLDVRMGAAHPEPRMTGVVSTTHGDCDCDLRTDGVVDCFGTPVQRPQCPVAGLHDVRALDDRCAIMTDGTVRCWGEMLFARDGGTPDVVDLRDPTAIDGITDATTLALGLHHNCVLTSAGAVLCWGANSVSQIKGSASMAGVWPPIRVDGR